MQNTDYDVYSMDEFKLIRCLMDLMNGNPVHACTLKERTIRKKSSKIIRDKGKDEPVYYNMVLGNPSIEIKDVLQYVFEDKKMTFGCMVSAYAFTTYCTIYHPDSVLKVLRLFLCSVFDLS